MRLLNFYKRNEKSIYTAACAVLFLFCAIKLVFSIQEHYRFLTHPYQLEYREGAGLVTAQDFIQDKNPFSIILQPQHTYTYGFLYPYIVSLIANVYENTLFVHRVFTYLFISATCLIVFFVLLRKKVNFVLAFSALVLLHQSIVNATYTAVARPEGLGMFLMTLGIIIPWRYNYSWSSLITSIVFGILAFLTKQYYILSIPVIALYLFLFISKEKSVKYSIISVISLLFVVLTLDHFFPMYINNTFFMHVNISGYLYSHMKDQLAVYAEINLYLILIILMSLFISVKEYLSARQGETVSKVISNIKKNFHYNTNTKIYGKEPMIKSETDFLFLFTLLVVLFVFMINLGGNKGNSDAVYLFQLASPYLILVTILLLDSVKNKLFKSLACLLLVVTLNLEFNIQRHDYAEFASCFRKVEDVIKVSRNPLNSPENVSIMISQNKPVYNSGLTEFFHLARNTFRKSSGSSQVINNRLSEFRKEVNEKIRKKEFDVILLTENYFSYFIDPEMLKQNYNFKDKICAKMIYQNWNTEVWVPKD